MNAMAFDVMVPLRDALQEVSLDNDRRVVVITGAGFVSKVVAAWKEGRTPVYTDE